MGAKKYKKRIRIMTLDTETRGLEGAIFRAGLFDGKHYWAYNVIDPILQVLENHSKKYKCHVFIHNADFDLSKFYHLIAADVDYSSCIFINGSAVMVPYGEDIIFHCSAKLLPGSLERLSKSFGLENQGKMDLSEVIKQQGYKDKEDYFKRVPADDEILNEYMKMDCLALYNIINQVIDISGLALHEFVRCPTVASLAMKVFKEGFNDDYKDAISTNYKGEEGMEAEDIARAAYYGGRTEVFIPMVKDFYHYDVNSLYPYVMKVNEFPIGGYDIYRGHAAEMVFDHWRETKKGAGMIKCLIKVPEHLHIPPLPYRDDPKLIFPVGTLEGTWIYDEVEMALEYGCEIIQIYECLHFRKTANIFNAYVSEMEEIKTTSKGGKREFAKLMQNSLYGKFGMQRERETFANIEDREKIEEKGLPYHVIYNKLFSFEFIETVSFSNAEYIQPHIAAYVTGYARMLLYRAVMEVYEREGKIAYCDTDSMVIDRELPEEMVDENAYGKWALESLVKEGIFYQPKLYFEKDENGKETKKAKGVPRSKVDEVFSRETYYDLVEATIKGQDRFLLYDQTTDIKVENKNKLGSSLKHNKDPNLLITLQKSLNLRSKQKRIMDYEKNTSKPHIMTDLVDEPDDEYNQWLREQKELFEKETALNEFIEGVGKIKIPTGQYAPEYKGLTQSSKRKYFARNGLEFDAWIQEVNDLFDAEEYSFDDIFNMIRRVEMV